jgi:thioredoxin-related protein
MLKNSNWIKGIREYLIKHFAFYYNSAYTVYKDTKYNTG